MSHTLYHDPVLTKEVLGILFFENVKTVFDGTVGLGGHAQSILENFPQITKYIACDLDTEHLEYAQKRLSKWRQKTLFYHSNFSKIKKIIQEKKVPHPLVIFLDLGLCSNHVDDAAKGFSFQKNGPLKMTFETESKENGETLINGASEEQIIQILRDFGEEPKAKKIAEAIVKVRKMKPLKTTFDLKDIIENTVFPREQNKTLMRVFQAFRIAVNHELDALQKTLSDAITILEKGDRMGIISYHALEDRIVKNFFTIWSHPVTAATEYSLHTPISPALGKCPTKKPIAPSPQEIEKNPRSRSARFRIFEKI